MTRRVATSFNHASTNRQRLRRHRPTAPVQFKVRSDAHATAPVLLSAVGSSDRQCHRHLTAVIDIVGGPLPRVETARSVLELPKTLQAAALHVIEQQKSPLPLKLHTIWTSSTVRLANKEEI